MTEFSQKRIALVAHDDRKEDLIKWFFRWRPATWSYDCGSGTGYIDFSWDPMAAQPHDVDVKALLRMSVLYNIPTACNRSTADYFISSQLFNQNYEPIKKNYGVYLNRKV